MLPENWEVLLPRRHDHGGVTHSASLRACPELVEGAGPTLRALIRVAQTYPHDYVHFKVDDGEWKSYFVALFDPKVGCTGRINACDT